MKKFIFFLVEKDGRSRQIKNGVVTSLTQAWPLPNAPDGNQEISIGWERSTVLHSNMRNYGLDLGFVLAGATMLRNDYYKFNIDRELFLLAKRLTYEWTPTTFKEYYRQYYKGQIDFATAEDDQGGYRFKVGLLDGDIQRKIKSNENTKFEYPFDADTKNVNMDGMFIQGKLSWNVTEYPFLSGGYPGMYIVPSDNPVPGVAVFDVQINNDVSLPDKESIEYFMATSQTINGVKLTGRLDDFNSLGAPGPLSVLLYVFNTITDSITQTIDLTPADPYPENYSLVIDQTLNLVEGDRVFLKTNSTFKEGVFNIDAKSKPVASVIRGFTVYDMGRKIVEKLTGSADNFVSPFLESKNVILSSGDGIRSIDPAAIKTSWTDFVKFCDVQFGISVKIADKVYINERLDAYIPESVSNPAIELASIEGLKVSPATELMFTSVKAGHADPQVDDTNGKRDFTGYITYKLPITGLADKQMDLQSTYKTSPFEIEQVRAKYEDKVTTDRVTDNDVYALAVTPAGNDTFESTVTFSADGGELSGGLPLMNIVAPTPLLKPGMKYRITGSTLNDKEYTVRHSSTWFFGQLVIPNESLVDEPGIVVTVEILEGQYYNLDRSIPVNQLLTPDDVSQEIKDSIYNVPFSPRRVIETHKRWLASMLANYAPANIEFGEHVRNKEMIAGGLVEKANIAVGSLGDKMWLPHWFEFISTTPIDLPLLMETNPNPVIAFPWKGTRYTGFLFRVGMALNDLEEQEYKLLACPENDLLNLIDL